MTFGGNGHNLETFLSTFMVIDGICEEGYTLQTEFGNLTNIWLSVVPHRICALL